MTVDIGFFLPSFDIGGAERVTINLANGFANRGYSVDLVLPSPQGLLRTEVDPRVRVVDLQSLPFPGYTRLGDIPFLMRYLRRTTPTWFYTAMNHINVPNLIAWNLARVPTQIIVTEHIDPRVAVVNSTKNRFVYAAAKELYSTAGKLVAVSDGVVEGLSDIVGVDRDAITRIYNPIVSETLRERSMEPLNHKWFSSDDYKVVLGIGRLSEQKQFSDLVEAVSLLADESVRLVLIGDGPKRDELASRIAELGLSSSSELLGYVDNPYQYMRNASVTALPSIREGFGNVLVEAMACGCPVVATDCPSGPAEILDNGEYGRLVSVGNPSALAAAIGETLEEPVDEDKLITRASDFSIKAAVDQYERLLWG
ncbi:glycosyltransferase [Halobaculum magnesiiphilum]|uniref:Glycosyltransferase n=1 Tax=Halobaculum magnesiiphilum TaxID=1017351 RepID=A0A8T8WEH1_9EURY|nr:glycosyltransferase [Halobaculum magnesiiphilum]QZP38245.1 glycosyltransferase [Halobaculum magnesiiphilum]